MPETEKIEEYFKYVAHHLKPRDYQREYRLFSFISRRLFAGTEVIGLEPVVRERREEERQGNKTVNIYVARHLSEFDWQEIQRLFGGADMMSAIQAGDNLFIGPLDPVLRHLGAFKVFRGEARIFSDDWRLQILYGLADRLWSSRFFHRFFSALGLRRRSPLVVDQMLARDIYVAYMHHLIHVEGRDVLLFPEYSKEADKKVKYGRSYSGRLLEFTPLIFKLLRDINKKTDRRIQIIPVTVSYERVVEDQTFRTLEQMKANRATRRLTYIADYFFNYTHWLYQRKKGRVVIKFGEPIQLRKKMDFKLRLHDEARKKVGALQTVFPTQVVGLAFHDAAKLSEAELAGRVEKTLEGLRKVHADLRYVEGMSPAEIIRSAYEHFHMHRKRCVLTHDAAKKTYRVVRPDVIAQYRNHIAHLFEKWQAKDEIIKIIDIFRDGSEKKSF